MDFVQQLSNITIPKMDTETKRFLFLMFILQNSANLTYKEARAVLMEIHKDSVQDLAEIFGCSTQAIYGFRRKGLVKAMILFENELSATIN